MGWNFFYWYLENHLVSIFPRKNYNSSLHSHCNWELWQGSNRIDLFWFAKIWFAKVNKKSQKDLDSRGESKYFTYEANESQWFILIHFDFDFYSFWFAIEIDFIHFDSVWFMIHLRIIIKSNLKSKIGESWFTHLRIIFWFDFESKANQSESRIKLVRPLVEG